MRGGVRIRLSLGVALVAAAASLFAASAAKAQCTPDPAVSGQTVTCNGNDPDGFQAGGGVNNLTVNVQPGATVFDNGTAAIQVNDGNTVTNRGALTAGAGTNAIASANANNIINIGTITLGAGAFGIVVGDNSPSPTSARSMEWPAPSAFLPEWAIPSSMRQPARSRWATTPLAFSSPAPAR